MFGALDAPGLSRATQLPPEPVQGLQVALRPLLSAERRRLGSRRSVGGRKVGYPSRPSACRASRRNPPSSQPRCRSPRWSRSTAAARRRATWTIGIARPTREVGVDSLVDTGIGAQCQQGGQPDAHVIADLHGLYLISDAHMDVATADALFGSEGAEAFAHPAVTRRVADLETRRPRKRCADGQQPAAVQLCSFCREPTHVGQVGSEFVDAMAHGRVGLDLAAGQLELKIQTQCRRGFRNRSIVGGRQPGGRVDEDEFFFDADGRGRRFVAASGGFGRAGGAHARVYPVGRRRKPTRGSPVLVGRTGPVVGLANISEASTSPCTPYESGDWRAWENVLCRTR